MIDAPKTVIFFSNGNTAAFDGFGQQIPGLQESWLRLYVAFLQKSCGTGTFDPSNVEFTLPDGRNARLFWTGEGDWNWSVK